MKTIVLCASRTPDPDHPDHPELDLICYRERDHDGQHWRSESGQHWYGAAGEPLHQLVPEEGDGLTLTPEVMERLGSLPDVSVTLTGVFDASGEA